MISKYEFAATQRLRQAGFRASSLYSAESRKIATNPTHFLWRSLIEKQGIPFIKVELIALNPSLVSDVDKWRMVVARRAPELVPIIDNHLARIVRSARRGSNLGTAMPNLGSKISTRFIHNDEYLSSRGMRMLAIANVLLFKLIRGAFAVRRSIRRALSRGEGQGG
jgi:hypothetical protein